MNINIFFNVKKDGGFCFSMYPRKHNVTYRHLLDRSRNYTHKISYRGRSCRHQIANQLCKNDLVFVYSSTLLALYKIVLFV